MGDVMLHDLQRNGFTVHRTARPLQDLARIQPATSNRVAEPLLQRQRHHAFILTLAHELQEPLSAMRSAIRTLRDEQGSPTTARAVEVIDRQAHHMDRLVEDLIESAQWADGKTLMRVQRVDVRTRIAEALSDVGKAASARDQQIVASDMPEPLWVDGDPARLRQVLSGLLDNAIKFSEPGGRIHLSAWRDGQQILARVSDTGRGLHPHEVAHIFELFSQVRPGQGRGLGIGLTVAWQIVALHKGRIDVRSDGLSCGSEFTVTLPAAAQ